MKPSVYLDFNATTPLDSRVLEAMMPYLTEKFGNASSTSHHWGWDADAAVRKSRTQISDYLKVKPSEIIFTSGATESNSLALKGFIFKLKKEHPTEPIHIITSTVEHPCVLQTLKDLTEWPTHVELTLLPVNQHGQISMSDLNAALKPHTRLLSLMWVHNELGSVNPMKEISALTREKKIIFHTDATQAVGKVETDLSSIDVDLLSFSGHKIYGPKGVGALYVRSHNPHVSLSPLFSGGGQERNIRSGTLNVAGIVGLGEAIEIYKKDGTQERENALKLKAHLLQELQSKFPKLKINTARESSPTTLHVTFTGFKLPMGPLPFAASQSSACSSGSLEQNQVLKAIGLTEIESSQSLRISIGRHTTQEELSVAVTQLSQLLTPIS